MLDDLFVQRSAPKRVRPVESASRMLNVAATPAHVDIPHKVRLDNTSPKTTALSATAVTVLAWASTAYITTERLPAVHVLRYCTKMASNVFGSSTMADDAENTPAALPPSAPGKCGWAWRVAWIVSLRTNGAT